MSIVIATEIEGTDFSAYWACRVRAYQLLGLPRSCSDDQLLADFRCRAAFDRLQMRALDSVLPTWRGGRVGLGRWRWVIAELERLIELEDAEAESDDDNQQPFQG